MVVISPLRPVRILCGIGLVADIPDDAVLRGVVEIVQGHGQLDAAQAGAKMAAGTGHRVNQVLAQLLRHFGQPLFIQLP